jgi:hypothetical protein
VVSVQPSASVACQTAKTGRVASKTASATPDPGLLVHRALLSPLGGRAPDRGGRDESHARGRGSISRHRRR